MAAIFFIGRTRTEGSNRRSSRVQWELAHIAEAPGGKAAEGGLILPPPSDMPTYIGFSLPILQPLNCNTDVDGQMLHLTQGHFPDIAALEVDIEVHTHLPEFPLLLFFGKEGL